MKRKHLRGQTEQLYLQCLPRLRLWHLLLRFLRLNLLRPYFAAMFVASAATSASAAAIAAASSASTQYAAASAASAGASVAFAFSASVASSAVLLHLPLLDFAEVDMRSGT